MHKKGHGTGVDMTFPEEKEIKENGFHEQFYAPMFGDGSQPTPQNYWAALGGSGLWILNWNLAGEHKEERGEIT